MSEKIDGILFDMDGLMFDTEKLLTKYWCEAAAEFGYKMEKEHVLGMRSMCAKYTIPYLKNIFGEQFDYHAVRSRRIELMNKAISENGVEKKKGLDQLLEYLKTLPIKAAVATCTDRKRTALYLKKAGLAEYFDSVVCGDMIKNGKPEPDIYLAAAKSLELSPSRCFALEDSPNGVLSAYRAGCNVIMIPDLSQPDSETSKLLYRKVDCLSDIIGTL